MQRDQTGFTLVEMVLAAAIFSFALLILTSGMLRLFNIYQNGMAVRATQQAARYAVDQMTRDIQASSSMVSGGATRLCVYFEDVTQSGNGNGIVYYMSDNAGTEQTTSVNGTNVEPRQLRRAVLTNVPITTCPAASTATQAASVTSQDASVLSLGIGAAPAANPKLATVTLRLAASNSLDLVDATLNCKNEEGQQYCSVTEVVTSAATGGGL